MPRYFYIGLLFIFIVVGARAALIFYKTPEVSMAEFGGVSLRIEYATSTLARERGLSGRKSIPNDYGMLFIFPKNARYGFWMKDMLIPIDIFWLDAQGQVVFIASDVATSTYPNVFYPSVPARYVLETAAGFTRRNSISIGTPLLLKNFPSVSE